MGKKYKILRVIITVGILCVVGIICIVLDYYLKFETKIFENLVEIMFNLMATIVGIWATCYLNILVW